MSISDSEKSTNSASNSDLTVILVPLHPETASIHGELTLTEESFPFVFGRRTRHGDRGFRPPPEHGLQIDDKKPIQVSRDHCAMELRDGRLFLVDRGSTLGTRVGRVQLGRKAAKFEAPLPEGVHEVVLGNRRSPHRFRITVSGGE